MPVETAFSLVTSDQSKKEINHGNCKEGSGQESAGKEGCSREEGRRTGQEGCSGEEGGARQEGCSGEEGSLRRRRPAKKRTPNAAFMKALTPSPALAAVVGSTPLPRTAVVSKLWDYIKKNNLQDKANKRNINADAKLKEIFGKPQVSMFELASLIGKHVK